MPTKPQKNHFVYLYNHQLYINLTNRCNNDCVFCVRTRQDGMEGANLWLDFEPSALQVIQALQEFFDKNKYDRKEVVFCGYGESTYCLDAMVQVADFLHEQGFLTRLNTNGLGATIHQITNQQLVDRLVGKIDKVSVSLLAATAEEYDKLARPCQTNAYLQVIDFGRVCKAKGIVVEFSMVDIVDDSKKQKVKALCDEMGVGLRIREFLDN